MVFTEIIERNGKKYFYRVESVRQGKKVAKKRKYLGVDLDKKSLSQKEKEADKELGLLSSLLTQKEIESLEKVKKEFANESSVTYENRYEAFCSEFTHDSNAIEGNTLTLKETSELLFDELVPAKSLREVNETTNHKKAFDYLLKYEGELTKDLICILHSFVVKDTLKKDVSNQVGIYRTSNVFLRGVEWLPPKSEEVPGEMKTLLSWYSKNKAKIHPLILASYFHVAFETIHPFVDGNGRVGRLLMNFILRKNKFPMVNIPNKRKREYYGALHDAQVKGNLRLFVSLVYGLLIESELRF